MQENSWATRKIKIRGWHTKLEQMFPAEELARDQLTLQATGQFINVNSISTRLSEIYPVDKFIPMQSTGFCDEKDVEIYEGDLVRRVKNRGFQDEEVEVLLIKWGSWCYVDQHGRAFDSITARSNCEVIGNLFENPDLFSFELEASPKQ